MKEWYQAKKEILKEKSLHAVRRVRKFLVETPAEVAIGAVLGITFATGFAYNHEAAREMKIPLGFSELSQMERDAQARGEELGPMTQFLPRNSDAPMKTFEAWNKAHEHTPITGQYLNNFARELDMITEKTFKTHKRDLTDLLTELPKFSQNALDSLKDFQVVAERIRPINTYLSDAWSESHVDNYHPEPYFYECGTADHPQTCTGIRMVYDDTTHTYTYKKEAGEIASKLLDKLLKDQEKLEFNERIKTARTTNAEGEYAAELSRQGKSGYKKLTQEDLLKIANTWKHGSTLETNLPEIFSMWHNIHPDADKWRESKKTAKFHSYKTTSSSDSGPIEFQIAKAALEHGSKLYTNINEIITGIEYTRNQAPLLQNKIKEFIAVELDKKPGNSKALANDIMNISKEIYSKNIKNGFEIDRFRLYVVLLGGFLGGIAGAGIGLGIDQADNKFRLYQRLNLGKDTSNEIKDRYRF